MLRKLSGFACLLIALGCSAQILCAQPRQIGHIYDFIDQASDIAVRDSCLYLVSPSQGFYIFDISNPASPRLITRYRWLGYQNVCLGGEGRIIILGSSYDWVSEGLTFFGSLVDVSDPENSVILSRFSEQGGDQLGLNSFTVSSRFIEMSFWTRYHMEGDAWESIYEIEGNRLIHNIFNPNEMIGFVQAASTTDRIYEVWRDSLRIINMTDCAAPFEIAKFAYGHLNNWMSYPPVLDSSRDILAIGCDSDLDIALVKIIGDSLSALSNILLTDRPKNIQFRNDELFWTTHDTLWGSDISDPENPGEPQFGILPPKLAKCLVSGSNLFALDSTGKVSVISISNPTAPEFVTGVGERGTITQSAFAQNRLFVAAGEAGLRVLDVSDPTSPHETGFWASDSGVTGVAIENNLAVVKLGSTTLGILDITDSDHIALRSTLHYNGDNYPWAFQIRQSFLYSAWNATTIIEHDLSDPANPREIKQLQILKQGTRRPFEISEGRLFLPSNSNYLIYSIEDPAARPVLVDSMNLILQSDYKFDGDYLHSLGYESNEVRGWNWFYDCYNIHSPHQPIHISHTPVGWSDNFGNSTYYFIYSKANLAVIDNEFSVIRVMDGDCRDTARMITEFRLTQQLYDISFSNDLAFVSQGSSLGIYDFSGYLGVGGAVEPLLPTTTLLLAPYPNPFNGSLTIPFELAKDGAVRLTMIDPLGRVVADLTPQRWLAAGRHSVYWNGAAVPSGAYFVRLVSGGEVKSEPVRLVK